MPSRQTGAREQILNVAETAHPIIEQIFTFSGSIEPPCDGYGFTGSKLQREVPRPPVAGMGRFLFLWGGGGLWFGGWFCFFRVWFLCFIHLRLLFLPFC